MRSPGRSDLDRHTADREVCAAAGLFVCGGVFTLSKRFLAAQCAAGMVGIHTAMRQERGHRSASSSYRVIGLCKLMQCKIQTAPHEARVQRIHHAACSSQAQSPWPDVHGGDAL